jgi:hypothetical protein
MVGRVAIYSTSLTAGGGQFRIHAVSLASISRARVYAVSMTTAPGKVRIYKVNLQGETIAVTGTPTTKVEPATWITLRAATQDGSVPTSYTWTCTAGNASFLTSTTTGTNDTVRVLAPSSLAGVLVTMTAYATIGGSNTPTVTSSFEVYPQGVWRLNATGRWAGVGSVQALPQSGIW